MKDGGSALHHMTLRDWFAGQALAVAFEMLKGIHIILSEKNLAREAYEIADALLAAREAK